jgi:hypothetical protein
VNAIRRLLKDRKASQRGSVLSGVLFMTAFIAIISGALMTALSTNFLLSHNLMTRLTNQATLNSAIESSISQLQATQLNAGCPSLQSVNVNSSRAVTAYESCWPTFRERQYPPIASSSPFNVDGSHSVISRNGQNLYEFYLVGDSNGNVYQFDFATSRLNWSRQLPGMVSGPPVAVPDMAACCIDDIANLVPLATQSGAGPAECRAGGCVAFLAQDGSFTLDSLCYMAANGAVTTAPSVGVNNPGVYFFGDQTGVLFAYAATESGNCALLVRTPTTGQPVVGGPVLFGGPVTSSSKSDEIYAVTFDGISSWLRHYRYTVNNGSVTLVQQVPALQLAASRAVGLAVDGKSLPARVAITFAGGGVSLVQIQSGYGMQLLANGQISAGIAGAPNWCCGGSPSLIGVAQTNALYVLDANQSLKVIASYATGTTISGSPSADAAGDWFFGADNGNVYEAPAIQSTRTLVTFGSGQLGRVRSSVQLGVCPAGICIYLGSLNGNAYIVPLNARNAVVTACISSTPPSCSGATPRLRAQIEVGAAGNPNSVHVQGWSYYSS